MTNKLCIFLLFVSLFSNPLIGQENTRPAAQKPKTIRPGTTPTQKTNTTKVQKSVKEKQHELVRFNTRMQNSLKEIKWSKTYYRSFKRTHEVNYLKLSASQCQKAIQSLNKTQSLLPRTTRFHHVAKNTKHQACEFFKRLQHESFQLPPRHYLRDANKAYCTN